MKFVLVVDRAHLFPRLSPQGLLPPDAVDLPAVERHAFFAEREFMESCSHFKQVIPYIALTLDGDVLCYQRQAKHSEQRLGGLWTVGFGGHIEPIDRTGSVREHGLLRTAALRELKEETGLDVDDDALQLRGFINSERTDVSTVHFGVFYVVDLAATRLTREQVAELVQAQAEPYRVAWRSIRQLDGPAPEDGAWEDWTEAAITALT